MSVTIEGLPGPIFDPEAITIKGEVVPDAPTMFSAEDFRRIQAISHPPRAENGKAVHPSEKLFVAFTDLSNLLNKTYSPSPAVTIHAPSAETSGIIVDPDVIFLIKNLHKAAADSESQGDINPNQGHRLPDRQALSFRVAVGYTVLPLVCYAHDTERLNNEEREPYTEQLQTTLRYIQDAAFTVPNIYHSVQDMSIFEKSVLIDALGLHSEDPQKLHSISTRQYIQGCLALGQSWTDVKGTVASLSDTVQKDTAVQIFRDMVRTTAQTKAEKDLRIFVAAAALHPSKEDTLNNLREALSREIATLFDTHSPEEATQRTLSHLTKTVASAVEIVNKS